MDKPLRIFSFGGGVQSTAVMVLAAQGKVSYDAFVFANVGNDGENPATLEYMENYTKPYAKKHGLEQVEVARNGDTLLQYLMSDRRTIDIPIYMDNGAPGNRGCTTKFKIQQVNQWAKKQGATHLITGLGISIDEIHRARTTDWYDTDKKLQHKREYPLIDLMLTREDCRRIITSAGLPVPPPSSCYFCPFKRPSEWVRMREEQPELFAKAVEIDYRLREKREILEKDPVYIHRSLKPLDIAVGEQITMDFYETDMCESGYCMT
jgi:3'-phosphoadenosine 5'-phosphosulfate sulfotransferase (PAPS reductase)/FAD synthetase